MCPVRAIQPGYFRRDTMTNATCRIALQPKTGKFSLRNSKSMLLGVFATYALAADEAILSGYTVPEVSPATLEGR